MTSGDGSRRNLTKTWPTESAGPTPPSCARPRWPWAGIFALSSLPLAEALTAGLNDSGVEVWDLGLCGTEQVYFYTSHLRLDGGIMVTASHNPPDYNGMKLVRREGPGP